MRGARSRARNTPRRPSACSQRPDPAQLSCLRERHFGGLCGLHHPLPLVAGARRQEQRAYPQRRLRRRLYQPWLRSTHRSDDRTWASTQTHETPAPLSTFAFAFRTLPAFSSPRASSTALRYSVEASAYRADERTTCHYTPRLHVRTALLGARPARVGLTAASAVVAAARAPRSLASWPASTARSDSSFVRRVLASTAAERRSFVCTSCTCSSSTAADSTSAMLCTPPHDEIAQYVHGRSHLCVAPK